MQLGVRGKLFLASVLLLLLVGGISMLYLEHQLRDGLERRTQMRLKRQAWLIRDTLSVLERFGDLERLDRLADQLGRSSHARVTIIARRGRVLGDSDIALKALHRMERHDRRPEVLEAKARGVGLSRRYSTTLHTHMLYIAVPYKNEQHQGFVRIAMPLHEVEATIRRLRLTLLFAGLFGLLVAILMSGLASHLMSMAFRELLENARNIAQVKPEAQAPLPTQEKLPGIGGLQQTAREWEDLITTLTAERNRFEAVLRSMNAAVLALDHEFKITLANPPARSRLGLSGPLDGRSFLEVVGSPELEEIVRKTQQGEEMTAEFDLPGPLARRVLARATPLQATAGVVLVIHDITHLRRLETIRRDFVANVSHELRTPLSIIQANAETLLDGAKDDPIASSRFLEAIVRNINRLSNLIDDLLDLSKLEANQTRLACESLDLNREVQSAIEAVKTAKSKHITIQPDFSPDLRVWADARALEQILFNLLDNAVKYTPEGGKVILRTEPQQKSVRIEVQDNGPGLAPHHRERIFERFYRVDEGRSRGVGGTGLGLAIVKHLTQAMHGKVGVSAANPQGSVFWFTLPIEPSPPPVAALEAPLQASSFI